jgi:hypothetical protein
MGTRQISSSAPFCRINATFHLLSERRIYAAGKISVVRTAIISFSTVLLWHKHQPMEMSHRPDPFLTPAGLKLAPIHGPSETTLLRVCLFAQLEPESAANPYVLLRELPGSRVYLGAVADAEGRIQELIEIWVQTLEQRDLAFSSIQERLTNYAFDLRWLSEYKMTLANLPETVIVTGMEAINPGPLVIKLVGSKDASAFLPVETTTWRLCQDDALLESFGLPAYSKSPFRYLHEPQSSGAKTFVATAADAPVNSHVQGTERLQSGADPLEIFNLHAGLVRVMRLSPVALEDYLQILEGLPWQGFGVGSASRFQHGIYADLQGWAGKTKGLPFLLHGGANPAERLNEVFFLKLSALLSIFKAVQTYVRTQQLPLLNLSPASFGLRIPDCGEQFPALWTAKCSLVRPGQAYPLKIKTTEQKYFIRLGRIEPSPFLPEGLGAHSFGIGSVRVRSVAAETDGTVLEGTLVAEDYLGLDPHDLLWFKLPLAEERLEFYAHVYTAEAVGPKEARFRTVPARIPEAAVAILKRTGAFAKSPYEIWPLLSSPCDLHSLGIIAIRVLLANSRSNFPVIVDDFLGLSRYLGKEEDKGDQLLTNLNSLLQKDRKMSELVSPFCLTEGCASVQTAWAQIHKALWLDAIALLLRLFPGAGAHSYCKGFGDVPPLALETVFDRPVQELEILCLRLRSVLAPSLAANEEIASVLLEELSRC